MKNQNYTNYDLLRLVNKDNPIPFGFHPRLERIYEDLDFYGDARCIDALKSMISDCSKAGFDVLLSSAYRSCERQTVLFEDTVREYMDEGLTREAAEIMAAKSVAPPMTSEHHTGLAFDIIKNEFEDFDDESVLTPDKEWLISHCHEYGFILRYPAHATAVTGIIFEPWHFRYVGTEAAEEIMRLGITLEEFLLSHIADINGPFSFVHHDRLADTWYFACDRFGAIPLFFAIADGVPVFSDSLNTLTAKPSLRTTFREDLLEVYLSFSYLPAEDTFFGGIKKALPGYLYEYHHGSLTKQRYFTPSYAFDKTKSLDQWADDVRNVLDDICDHEDKGVTALLSSGIDSNYLCTRLKAKETYTATYSEENISEAPAACGCAHQIGANHHEVMITPEQFFELTADAMEALGEPSGDASAPVLLGLYREISKNADTCYSGEGIDELFMGYYYRDMNAIPKEISLRDAEYLGCTQGFNEAEKKRILKHYSGTKKMSYTEEAYALSHNESRLDQAALVDMLVWLSGNLLPNVYLLGGSCGLQINTPYLDNRLYDLSLEIPAEYKNNTVMNKMVFRRAAENILGKDAILKPKKGFPVPITSWLKRPECATKVRSAFSSDIAEKFFCTDRLIELYDAFLNDAEGRLSWRPVWCLYCFIIWYGHVVRHSRMTPHWLISDPEFNKKEAWPKQDFPDATLCYFKEAGCLVTALATMVRYYGIETETDQTLFNPWILNERLKKVGGFDPCADLIPGSISKLYPIEYIGNEPFSIRRLSKLLSEGKFCLVTVPGVHADRHFVLAVSVENDDATIIDSGWDKSHLSEFGNAMSIYAFSLYRGTEQV